MFWTLSNRRCKMFRFSLLYRRWTALLLPGRDQRRVFRLWHLCFRLRCFPRFLSLTSLALLSSRTPLRLRTVPLLTALESTKACRSCGPSRRWTCSSSTPSTSTSGQRRTASATTSATSCSGVTCSREQLLLLSVRNSRRGLDTVLT